MSEHKRQHYIPSSYLEAWCDPDTPAGQTPYVWLLSKKSGQISKKAPKKIFFEKDMYTIISPDGGRDLHLEYNLSRVESKFAQLRIHKLMEKQNLCPNDLMVLCLFVAAMYGRTKTFAEQQRRQWQKLVDMAENIQGVMERATPEQRENMSIALSPSDTKNGQFFSIEDAKELAEKPIQSLLSPHVELLAPLLFRRPYIIFEAPNGKNFFTSDDPCVWFDPAINLKPRPFGAGGLISPTLEISLPLSPNFMLFFGSELVRSGLYLTINNNMVDSLNKRTHHFANEFIVSNEPIVNLT